MNFLKIKSWQTKPGRRWVPFLDTGVVVAALLILLFLEDFFSFYVWVIALCSVLGYHALRFATGTATIEDGQSQLIPKLLRIHKWLRNRFSLS